MFCLHRDVFISTLHAQKGKKDHNSWRMEVGAMECCLLDTHGSSTHELKAAVSAYVRPEQDQSGQNSSLEEEGLTGSATAEELLAADEWLLVEGSGHW